MPADHSLILCWVTERANEYLDTLKRHKMLIEPMVVGSIGDLSTVFAEVRGCLSSLDAKALISRYMKLLSIRIQDWLWV